MLDLVHSARPGLERITARHTSNVVLLYISVSLQYFVLSYLCFVCLTTLGKERWPSDYWLRRLLRRSQRQDGGTLAYRRLDRHSVLLWSEKLLQPERSCYCNGEGQISVHVVQRTRVNPRLDGVRKFPDAGRRRQFARRLLRLGGCGLPPQR